MLDANALAQWTGETDGDGRPWAVVDPAAAYPATLDHIAAVLAGAAQPAPTVRTSGLVDAARALPAVAWDLARRPRGALDDREPDDAAALALRAEALEIARRWLTEALHAQQGHAPMALKILKAPDWRL